MTYPEAIDFLYNLRLFGTKLGLENTRELARFSGNPHEKLRFIHVAGTNGKGSTCAILESIYRAHGLKTGLFTSPHLVSFTERIQVNRQCIPEPDVARLTDAISQTLGAADPTHWAFHPTFFEFVTIMALCYFAEQECDIVIWETGMGGRLDATNIVTPLASVITNVQFDHQHWLGDSLEAIAGEKAGIIKFKVPVLTSTAPGPALEVIHATAKAKDAPLMVIDTNDPVASTSGDLLARMPLRGKHQLMNGALALAVVSALSPIIPVTAEALRRGIETVYWPGRLQVIHRGPSRILLDGAHNPGGAKTLAATLHQISEGQPSVLILGLFRDKAWQEMCDYLVPHITRLLLIPLSSERTVDPQEVDAYCRSKWSDLPITQHLTLANALDATTSDPFVIIAGSLHLIGEAMELLHISPSLRSERSLNEWNAANSPSTSTASGN